MIRLVVLDTNVVITGNIKHFPTEICDGVTVISLKNYISQLF